VRWESAIRVKRQLSRTSLRSCGQGQHADHDAEQGGIDEVLTALMSLVIRVEKIARSRFIVFGE